MPRPDDKVPLLPLPLIVSIVVLMNIIYGTAFVLSVLSSLNVIKTDYQMDTQLHVTYGIVHGATIGLSRIRIPWRIVRHDDSGYSEEDDSEDEPEPPARRAQTSRRRTDPPRRRR